MICTTCHKNKASICQTCMREMMELKKRKTASEMIIEYLQANGYDGLCNGDYGCKINDLIPCDQADNCVGGYLHVSKNGWAIRVDKPIKESEK